MLLFGILLWWADSKMPMARQAETLTFKHAFVLGMWQALALIPGTSRSGITITGARLLGYKRIDAARLSMLMSIPTILAAGGMETLDVIGMFSMFSSSSNSESEASPCNIKEFPNFSFK